jgi:precorrin-6A/cobalt-precorrin-6A reductase
MSRLNVLILGGASEASELARRLAGDGRFAPTLSFAGRTRAPKPPPIPFRIGGFGGVEGLAGYLREQGIGALIDATHPFAAQITANASAAAALAGVPLLVLTRPPWRPQPRDRWIEVPDMWAAADALGPPSKRALLTVGRKDLAPFVAAPLHSYVIRSIDPPPAELLPPNAEVVLARGPFAEPEERELLLSRRIQVIVTKNSGGTATEAKLAAARALALPVIMVDRPPPPTAETVLDPDAALRWLERLHGVTETRRGV